MQKSSCWVKRIGSVLVLVAMGSLMFWAGKKHFVIDASGPINYEVLTEKHTILEDNICTSSKSVYEDVTLCEYLEDDLEFEAKFSKEFDSPTATMEYFAFDFNDDKLEDYLVCFSGAAWSGSAGDTVRIYVKEEGGSLRKVFSVSARVREPYFENGYAPIAVLNEKTNGYYDFVLPWTENKVVKYNAENGIYEISEQEEENVHTNLTEREALDIVFDYLYADEDFLVDVTFYEKDDVIGYKWLRDFNMSDPMYLTQYGSKMTSQEEVYYFFRLASDLYGSSGTYMRTETYNEFAVNRNTGEVIEMRVYQEDGGWSYSEEYLESKVTYYADLIEEMISIENYLGHHPTSGESGEKRTDIYFNAANEAIYFVPQKSEVIYELTKYSNYERYSISAINSANAEIMNVDIAKYEWIGQAMVDYDVDNPYQLPELSEKDMVVVDKLLDYVWEQFAMRQEHFNYNVYLGDFLRGSKEGKECIAIYLAVTGDGNYYIYAELTENEQGYDVWLYPSPFGLPDKTKLDEEKTQHKEMIDNIVALDCRIGEWKK